MKHSGQIAVIIIGTLISLFGFGAVLRFTDPFDGNKLVYAGFYATLFLSTLGLATLFGIVIRRMFFYGLYSVNISISIRQGVLTAATLTGSLILLANGLLFWWSFLLIILFVVVLETFFHL